MSCCGGKRIDLLKGGQASSGTSARTWNGGGANPAPAPVKAPAPPVAAGAVAIDYLAGAPIRVIGSATRNEYRFSRVAPRQQVARADVAALLASGYFRRAG